MLPRGVLGREYVIFSVLFSSGVRGCYRTTHLDASFSSFLLLLQIVCKLLFLLQKQLFQAGRKVALRQNRPTLPSQTAAVV